MAKTVEMVNQITLSIGDPSNDGHGKHEIFKISCTVTATELEKAYKKGVKKVGFDLSVEVAEEYEDDTIAEELLEKLKQAGYKNFSNSDWFDNIDGEIRIDQEAFLNMYMFIANLGNATVAYKILKEPLPVFIGGYGLFH